MFHLYSLCWEKCEDAVHLAGSFGDRIGEWLLLMQPYYAFPLWLNDFAELKLTKSILYAERVCEVERGTFPPLVLCCCGGVVSGLTVIIRFCMIQQLT